MIKYDFNINLYDQPDLAH